MRISDLIKDQAKKHPNRIAFIFKEESYSYAKLEDLIGRAAQGLSQLGVQKGTTFGLVLKNSPEFVILVMALSKLGAVAVPINFLEKPDRVALILNDAKAMGVLTAKEFLPAVSKASKLVETLKVMYLRDGSADGAPAFSTLYKNNPLENETPIEEDDLSFLIYTSGTTGRPKGVMLSHRNLLANTEQCLGAIRLNQKDRFLCLLPMFHSFAWTTCVLVPLRLGAFCYINESLLPFDPVIKAIWNHKITLFVAVPQIYSALTAKIKGFKALFLRLLNPVRLCISGAAPLLPTIHKNFEKNFGIPLLEGYGLTETSPVATLNPVKKRKVSTVGVPLPGVTVELRDDAGKKVPQGEVGEIWIKGQNVMMGYYGRKAETNEILTSDGFLKSGDMGQFDDEGYLKIVDRKKDLIIMKGLNVYPQEVEAVIANDSSIKEVAVVGKMDNVTGEETIRAFVVLEKGSTLDKTALHNLCKSQLAPYKRPKEFIQLDEMPKNALQKILKKELRKR